MNQEEIEKKYLKNQLIPRLKEEAKDILKHFNIHGLDADIVLDILSYLLLVKSVDYKKSKVKRKYPSKNHQLYF